MLNTSIKLILIDGKHREKVLKILTSVLDDVFKIQNTDLNHNYCRCKLEKTWILGYSVTPSLLRLSSKLL